jgi:hypothetical protein
LSVAAWFEREGVNVEREGVERRAWKREGVEHGGVERRGMIDA